MKSTESIQKTALRVPRDLHEQIHQAAQASGRSFNAEIVKRLQESFERERWPKKGQEESMPLDEILQRLQEMAFKLDQIKKEFKPD